MAEPLFDKIGIPLTDVMTGDDDATRFLYYQLKMSMEKAERIDMITSFLMESGVKVILEDLKRAASRHVPIRILTGNYLGITEPSALFLLRKELGDRIELRFYEDQNRVFHPKSYFFYYEDYSEIFIGSSNLSKSALTSGIEWNYRLTSRQDEINVALFQATFEDLFEKRAVDIDDEVLQQYARNWRRPNVFKDLNVFAQTHEQKVEDLVTPRGVQIEALYALNATRLDGADRALIQAATGAGKTYIAAFDAAQFERILFVAPREELLEQAIRAFYKVRHERPDVGRFYGNYYETDHAITFATAAKLGKDKYLCDAFFRKDQFDYIILDECHHAVTPQYRRIASYFEPKFLLGMTATPERLDGKNVYEIFNYNAVYELSLKTAINQGVLVPFRYYGIYDDTDYSNIHLMNGHYDVQELNASYIGNAKRDDLIYKYYMKYGSRRAMGFCCSRQHALKMAEAFNQRGIPSAAVYSGDEAGQAMDRGEALDRLKTGALRVIFSVDMFNEGVDVPALDMVMFLRPTESPVVYLQQLGRGLRVDEGKKYLCVLDFIGNYQHANLMPYLLSETPKTRPTKAHAFNQLDWPDDCLVDFDVRLLDMFERMEEQNRRLTDRIAADFVRVQTALGHRPTRFEWFTEMAPDLYALCLAHSKDNPFRHYLAYLNQQNWLMPNEKALVDTPAWDFLECLESTDMTRVYKMPVLYAFLHDGKLRQGVSAVQLLEAWKRFFAQNANWKDLPHIVSYDAYCAIPDKQHLANILKNPVHFLRKSS